MSEKLHEAVKEVEVEEVAPLLTIRRIKARDTLKITKYLKEVDLLSIIIRYMSGDKSSAITTTWVDIRQEKGMSVAELNELKKEFGEDIEGAAKSVGIVIKKEDELPTLLLNRLADILTDDKMFDDTMEMLAFMFDEDVAVIEDLEIAEIIKYSSALMSSASFLA